MGVNAYINFPGNCREAVTFYADVFETPLQTITTYGEVDHGFPMPEAMKQQVMHTELQVLGSVIMLSDTPEIMPFTLGNNVTLVINSADAEQLQRFFARLSEGGTVTMPLQPTFWTKLYGQVIDRFGVGWQLTQTEVNS